jgi:hypothetical protein
MEGESKHRAASVEIQEPPAPPEKKAQKPWHCKNCAPEIPTRLQRVSYGHIEGGEFVIDEQTELACCYCHTVYSETEIKA